MGRVAFTQPIRLPKKACTTGFCSGEKTLDSWLSLHGVKSHERGTAVVYATYVAGTNPQSTAPAGYYTLSSSAIERAAVSGGWLARNTPDQIPVILLGRLAVDERFQGMGLGKMLLHDAAARAFSISRQLGAKALVVDPLNESVRDFYSQYGFRDIPGQNKMFARLH